MLNRHLFVQFAKQAGPTEEGLAGMNNPAAFVLDPVDRPLIEHLEPPGLMDDACL